MLETLRRLTEDKKVCLLGFGREGRSTYSYLREALPELNLAVLDKDEGLFGRLPDSIIHDPRLSFALGSKYLDQVNEFDLVIKSPGITLHRLNGAVSPDRLTSQTDLFLSAYHDKIIGVTGTKGKSTTASLIYHMIREQDADVLLVGNIGTPPFEMLRDITERTRIVFELSSHQLEVIHRSPGTAVLLNLFPEHLDHFRDIRAYHEAKLNITRFQGNSDVLIHHHDDPYLRQAVDRFFRGQKRFTYSLTNELEDGCFMNAGELVYNAGSESVSFSVEKFRLKGQHNLLNLMASVLACKLNRVDDRAIARGISSFRGLKHRLEFVGNYGGINFFNDSIATIPEATMEAIKALGKIDTLILGGYDRQLDYTELISFLVLADVRNIICTGDAGKRIFDGLKESGVRRNLFMAGNYEKIFDIIKSVSQQDGVCLLSPAAASYDMFKNFEERGELFSRLAKSI
jgi:UDP-N-acetylmuramoylalanine--D-glutamate ligase